MSRAPTRQEKMIGLALCSGRPSSWLRMGLGPRERSGVDRQRLCPGGCYPRCPKGRGLRHGGRSRGQPGGPGRVRCSSGSTIGDYAQSSAQAVANVEAAKARLANVDAEMALQHSLIRQAEAQRRSVVAELNLATKASDRPPRAYPQQHYQPGTMSMKATAAKSSAEANLLAASATVEAQQQRIAVLAAQREAAVAAVAQAEAASDLAGIDLESTVVRAPVGGVIGNRQVRSGRLVARGRFAARYRSARQCMDRREFQGNPAQNIRPVRCQHHHRWLPERNA